MTNYESIYYLLRRIFFVTFLVRTPWLDKLILKVLFVLERIKFICEWKMECE